MDSLYSEMKTKNVYTIKDIRVSIDKETGDITGIYQKNFAFPIAREKSNTPHFAINNDCLDIRLKDIYTEEPRCITTLQNASIYKGYCSGYRLHVRTVMVPGAGCLGVRTTVIRQLFDRHNYPEPGPTMRPVEEPLYVEKISYMPFSLKLFGKDTRMRVFNMSGNGPECHMGLKDGPIEEISKKIWHMIHRSYLGCQTIPGVAYYCPKKEDWLFITCRRANVGYIVDYKTTGPVYNFMYYSFLNVLGQIDLPEVVIYWGKGLNELDKLIAKQFEEYEEPSDWFYRTIWTELNFQQNRERGFDQVSDEAAILREQGGINGFLFCTHERRTSAYDTSPTSLRPKTEWGGIPAFRKMIFRLKKIGCRTIVWFPTTGLQPGGDIKPEWCIRGVDGSHWASWTSVASPHDEWMVAVNLADPGFQKYMFDWIRRYVGEYGVDGIFWDCGVSCFPCDFTPGREYQQYPSQSMVAAREFFEKAYELGKSINPEFVMYYEGICSEYPGNGFTTCSAPAFEYILKLNKIGCKKIMCADHALPYNFGSGFACINHNISGCEAEIADKSYYRKLARDPLNKFASKLVAGKGIKDAIGIRKGVSIVDGILCLSPGVKGPIVLPEEFLNIKSVEDMISGKKAKVSVQKSGEKSVSVNGPGFYSLI